MDKKLQKIIAITILVFGSSTAYANSVGFDSNSFEFTETGFSISIVYDFTGFAMFGGSVNVAFDSGAFELVDYVQAPLAADAQAQASPVGELVEPGLYSNVGIGTFEFTAGMNSAGAIGTFYFSFLGPASETTPCGFQLCLLPFDINPFVSLGGSDVTDLVLGNGTTEFGLPLPVPVPAAVWLLLSATGLLFGVSRRPNAGPTT